PAGVSFSPNGATGVSSTTVTFGAVGTYQFQVTVRDPNNLTATGYVSVTVSPVLTYIFVAPANVTLAPGASQQFSATAQDQFHTALASQPTISWSAASGTITATGNYTAPPSGTSDTVTASSGGVTGTANVTITSPSRGVLFADN